MAPQLAFVHLVAGATMDSNHLDADIFGDLCQLGRVQAAFIPAETHLDGYGNINRLRRLLHNLRRQHFIPHESGTCRIIDDFFDRAAEVDIDNGGTATDIDLGGFGHDIRFASSELYGYGELFAVIGVAFKRVGSLLQHQTAGDHFREYQTGAETFDDAAEGLIGDA